MITCPDCANLIADGIWTGDGYKPSIPEGVTLTNYRPQVRIDPCHWCGAKPSRRYRYEMYRATDES